MAFPHEDAAMPGTLFVSLPVADVARSRRFYAALGLGFDPAFESGHGACVAVNDGVRVMLVAREVFAGLSERAVADTQAVAQALFALQFDSAEAIDAAHRAAVAAGGTDAGTEDHGFMRQCNVYDPDGHGWALTWMQARAD